MATQENTIKNCWIDTELVGLISFPYVKEIQYAIHTRNNNEYIL